MSNDFQTVGPRNVPARTSDPTTEPQAAEAAARLDFVMGAAIDIAHLAQDCRTRARALYAEAGDPQQLASEVLLSRILALANGVMSAIGEARHPLPTLLGQIGLEAGPRTRAGDDFLKAFGHGGPLQ